MEGPSRAGAVGEMAGGPGLERRDLTQVVDVGRDPPAVWQLLQVVGSLVVAANEHGEHRGFLLARVVPAETRQLLDPTKTIWVGSRAEVGPAALTGRRSACAGIWPARPCTADPPRCARPGSPRSRVAGRAARCGAAAAALASRTSCPGHRGSTRPPPPSLPPSQLSGAARAFRVTAAGVLRHRPALLCVTAAPAPCGCGLLGAWAAGTQRAGGTWARSFISAAHGLPRALLGGTLRGDLR